MFIEPNFLKFFKVFDYDLRIDLAATVHVNPSFEGWLEMDITDTVLKWVGTMECEIIAQKLLIFGLDILKLKVAKKY